jgi:hypothetical protein
MLKEVMKRDAESAYIDTAIIIITGGLRGYGEFAFTSIGILKLFK